MIKQRLINLVKNNNYIYDIYFHVGSSLLKLSSKFVKINKKSILFVSYGGKKFDDSPKAIYDYIINEDFFEDFELIWAFRNPKDHKISRGRKIKIDSVLYFYIALQSGFWITNSAIERGLNYKNPKTYYINTWHGTPLKKIGTDSKGTLKYTGLGSKNIYTQNLMTAQSEYDATIFSRLFNIKKTNILICDLPRNDYLKNYCSRDIANIKETLGITMDKKVILYAPTYREYKLKEERNPMLDHSINKNKWTEKLAKDYVVLIRNHYEVSDFKNYSEDIFINVSDYGSLNDLMIISDVLISDYSSIFIDYSILERPMLCYAYDLEEYSIKRGLYLDLAKELPCKIAFDENTLLKQIKEMNYEKEAYKTKEFKRKYAPNSGESSKIVVNKLIEISKGK